MSLKKQIKRAAKLIKLKQRALEQTEVDKSRVLQKLERKVAAAEKSVRQADARLATRQSRALLKVATRAENKAVVRKEVADKLARKAEKAGTAARQAHEKAAQLRIEADAAEKLAGQKRSVIKTEAEKQRDAEKAARKAEKAARKAEAKAALLQTAARLKPQKKPKPDMGDAEPLPV
jgi:hypothetical protein